MVLGRDDLIVGIGGSGKTTLVEEWIKDDHVLIFKGGPPTRLAYVTSNRLDAALLHLARLSPICLPGPQAQPH
ncbi:hypothetical protein ACLB2K_003275 [Fragaria x ananassa]